MPPFNIIDNFSVLIVKKVYRFIQRQQFEPFSKNPPIAKVFREVSLADELGSSMRNTYKYTKLYSGGEPQFIEGDLFRTIIPLKPIATAKVGQDMDSDVSHQENHQEPISNRIIDFC